MALEMCRAFGNSTQDVRAAFCVPYSLKCLAHASAEFEKFRNVGDNAAHMAPKIVQSLILGCAVALGIAGCAPATGESTVVPVTTGSIVTALAPMTTPSPDNSAEVPQATALAGSPASEGGGQMAPAGSIDLRELTSSPDSAGADDFVELPAPGAPDTLAKAVQLAREDLSLRLQGDIEEAALVAAEAAVWSDRSLGCPRPNTAYIVEETPGFKIVLAAGGESYTYHTDLGQNVVLCLDGEPAPPLE